MPRTSLPTLLLAALALAGTARADDGEFDPRFWGGGYYLHDAYPYEVFVGRALEAPDGALVWAGARSYPPIAESFALWQRVSDDAAATCELTLNAGVRAVFSALGFDASGRLLAGGWVQLPDDSYALLFARYLYPGCALDPSFDGDGVKIEQLPGTTSQWVSAIAADGDAILFAAQFWTSDSVPAARARVGRLLPDGAYDSSFSGDGWLPFPGRGGNDYLTRLRRAPGRIYAGGWGTLADGTDGDFYLLALNPNGSPVSGFGTSGRLTIDFGASASDPTDELTDFAVLPDGKLLLVGNSWIDVAPGYAASIARATPDGALDPGFDGDGRRIDLGHGGYQAVATQGDGRYFLASTSDPWTSVELERFLPSGDPDPEFAGGGEVSIIFPQPGFHAPRDLPLVAGRPVVAAFLERQVPMRDLGAFARLTNRYVFADGFEIGSAHFWSKTSD